LSSLPYSSMRSMMFTSIRSLHAEEEAEETPA